MNTNFYSNIEVTSKITVYFGQDNSTNDPNFYNSLSTCATLWYNTTLNTLNAWDTYNQIWVNTRYIDVNNPNFSSTSKSVKVIKGLYGLYYFSTTVPCDDVICMVNLSNEIYTGTPCSTTTQIPSCGFVFTGGVCSANTAMIQQCTSLSRYVYFMVPGVQQFQDNVIPPGVTYPTDGVITEVFCKLNTPAQGSNFKIQLNADGVPMFGFPMIIPSNQYTNTFLNLNAPIAADSNITLDILSTGTQYPGEDLQVRLTVQNTGT